MKNRALPLVFVVMWTHALALRAIEPTDAANPSQPHATNADTFNSDGEFYVRLPDEWVLVPKKDLDAWVREGQRLMPKAKALLSEYSFAYQSNPKGGPWLASAYCIGCVNRAGRPNEADFIKFANHDAATMLPKAATVTSEVSGGRIQGSAFNAPIYDSKRHILWMSLKLNSAGGDSSAERKGVIARLLTSTGHVRLSFYASAPEFDAMLPEFQRMVEGIRFREPLQFRPQEVAPAHFPLSQSKPFDLEKFTTVALVSIFGVLGVWWRTRKAD